MRFLTLFVFLAGLSAAAAAKPNVLFIYTDDQTHRSVSCYPQAHKWVKTPNIDRLAARGVRFATAYVGSWCMPSRASMLTGLQQHGIESMRLEGEYPGSTYDPKLCPFWPSDFRKNGYVTAQIGKWHTGRDTGANRDWDYQAVWNRPRNTHNAGNYYYDQEIEFNGGAPIKVKGYSTDNYSKWAVDFIKGQNRDADKPWYLWLCYAGVHGPFTPADRHKYFYRDETVPVPKDVFPPRPGKPTYVDERERWVPDANGHPVMKGGGFQARTVLTKCLYGNTIDDWVVQYNQAVRAIDDGVGQVMQALEESGQLENTLVVFTSDQGFAWGHHGFNRKLGPYADTIQAPMIVSMPGTIPEGKVCDSPVNGVDLIPTFYKFAGLPLPWRMDGHDLTPLLKDPAMNWPHPAFMTMTGKQYGSATRVIPTDPKKLYVAGVPWWCFIQEGRYKYIRTLVENEPAELYDVVNDPEELNNLAYQKDFKNIVDEYDKKLIAELQRTKAPFVNNMPKKR